jgi:hypothetical protein
VDASVPLGVYLFGEAGEAGDRDGAGDEDEEDDVARPSAARLEDVRASLVYSGLLLTGVARAQKLRLGEFQLMFSCVDLASRPAPLSTARFRPWLPEKSQGREDRLRDLVKDVSADSVSGLGVDGIELIFEHACRVSPDFDFRGKRDAASELEEEPRHECERVLLSKQLITVFPSFAERAVRVFSGLQESLSELMRDPTNQRTYDEIERSVHGFVESLRDSTELDKDFLTAFAYKSDGTLYGDLWASLRDSGAKIVASLGERSRANRNWIAESIRDQALLEKGRRMRVRSPQKPKPEIPTTAEACVCRESWTAWMWNVVPYNSAFRGCAPFPDGGRPSFSKGVDTSGWKGFCRTQKKRASLQECAQKWAPCDPSLTNDTRPEFRIWRKGGQDLASRDSVTLPLVQTDLYITFQSISSRADICTPSFAPLLVKATRSWSTASWVPWELRKSNCFAARLHPPGVSVLIMRCNHGKMAPGKKLATTPKSVEWQVVITVYLVSYSNVWGTSEGDSTKSFFDGSWQGAAADKGFPGVLTNAGTWASSAAAGGMSTANVMSSSGGFWFAVVAEVLGALAVGMTSSGGSTSVLMMGIMYSVAQTCWNVLMRWGVVPISWGINVATKQVASALAKVTGIQMSPWRNEHDVILAVQVSRMSTEVVRKPVDFIRDMNADQMERAMDMGQAIQPFAQYWLEHQQKTGYAPSELKHLSRDSLTSMITTYIQQKKEHLREQVIKVCSQLLFESCPMRPRWYIVKAKSEIPVHPFYGKSQEKWIDDEKTEELFLIDHGDGWFMEITDPAEEDRFYPGVYVTKRTLVVSHDIIENQGYPHRQVTPVQLQWLLRVASLKSLQCWARVIHGESPTILKSVQEKHTRIGQDGVLPVAYFSEEYTRNFLSGIWPTIHTDNRSVLAELWFKRDGWTKYDWYKSTSIIKSKRSSGVEVSTFNRHSWGAAMQLLHRLGLPFLKIPALFQVQPYVELTVGFNVRAIMNSVMTRLGRKGTPSELNVHKGRIDKCKACVHTGMAFCDRYSIAKGMFEKGWTEDMDECVPRTAEGKEQCQKFVWNRSREEYTLDRLSSSTKAGLIFKDQNCPCYNQRSGLPMTPRWITSDGHCSEMRWPNADTEEDRRQMRAHDWKLGFTKIASESKARLALDDDLKYAKQQPRGCEQGYRCCGSLYRGREINRCVELQGITRTTSWFNRQKCVNYHPTDIKADKVWSHGEQVQCTPSAEGPSSFNGTWKVDAGGKWVEAGEAEEIDASVEAE